MKIGSVVVRCYEFDRMRAFWQQALHHVAREPAEGGWVIRRDPTGRGPSVSLDQAPEPRTGRRSRLHLDLYARDPESEVARLIGLGAVRYPWRYRPGDDFVVLADPDGNLFCVVESRERDVQSEGLDASPARSTTGRAPAALRARAVGALAFGAAAVGALAIGRLALGQLVIGRSRIRRLEIDDLDVKRVRVSGRARG